MSKIDTQRIDIRIPVILIKEIEAYQHKQGIANRTTALLELVRIGLQKSKE